MQSLKEKKEELQEWMRTVQHHWYDLFLVNFPVHVEKVQTLLHPHLKVETFQGNAYVSVVFMKTGHYKWTNIPIPKKPYREVLFRTYVIDHHRNKKGYWYFARFIDAHLHLEAIKRYFSATHFVKASVKWKQSKDNEFFIQSNAAEQQVSESITVFSGTVEAPIEQPPGLLEWLTDTTRNTLFYESDKGDLYERDIGNISFGPARAIRLKKFSSDSNLLSGGILNIDAEYKNLDSMNDKVFYVSHFSGDFHPEDLVMKKQ